VTLARKWLRWPEPVAIVKDRLFLSSERMSLKDYDHKGSGGLEPRQTD
jgi:hypothetical protein